jgi:CRP-like cAMP-binding protein
VRRDNQLEQLAAVQLFTLCSKVELRAISARVTPATVAAGKVLVREGELGRNFFVVVTGEAEISRNGTPVAKVGPGAYFGELALLDPAPRNATVTALTDMDILKLAEKDFNAVLLESPVVTRKILRGMAQRLRQLDLERQN